MSSSRGYTLYVTSIFVVKILFLSLAITHLVLSGKGAQQQKLDSQVVFWKDHIEFIFNVLMSFLLIYVFQPWSQVVIDRETKLLFFLFGVILLYTANWSNFIHNSPTLHHYLALQQTLIK